MIKTASFRSATLIRLFMPLFALVALALLGGCFQGNIESDAHTDVDRFTSSHCEAMARQSIAGGSVLGAEIVEQGKPLLGVVSRLFIRWFVPGFSGVDAPQSFCRLTLTLSTSRRSSVMVEAWLPDQWNGKVLGIGGGGFNGGLGSTAPLAMVTPLTKGYLVFVTDAGHEKTNSAKFAFDNREQLIDFAYRANQVAGKYSRSLASYYYGSPADKAYFHGCSNGGRDALMLAQRAPDLYDGIIAGAPAADWSRLMTTFGWWRELIFGQQGAPKIKKKLDLIHAAVLEKCDGMDGVQDELISNPLKCDFDPAVLECGAADKGGCLDKNEINILKKIYRGPQLASGTQVFPGLPPGGEGLENNWELWVTRKNSPGILMSIESFRWMAYRNPDWSPEDFDIQDALRIAEQELSPVMNANDPNLKDFFAHDGKLLLYHGWNDAAIPATATIAYYKAVEDFVGTSITRNSARLFLVPGMQHCFGGVGPTSFDLLSVMENWDESGMIPEKVIAKEYENPTLLPELTGHGNPVSTRPLCAWPSSSIFKGGDLRVAGSFECQ